MKDWMKDLISWFVAGLFVGGILYMLPRPPNEEILTLVVRALVVGLLVSLILITAFIIKEFVRGVLEGL